MIKNKRDLVHTAIVIPVLNEARTIRKLQNRLHGCLPGQCDVLLVDAGSIDETVAVGRENGWRVIETGAGRALQMNAGARQTDAQILWFLHADCIPPENAQLFIHQSVMAGAVWGRFDVRLSGKARVFRIIETLMNWRSCLTGVATGDQGIFMTRDAYDEVSGFPEIPLMEDVAISKRLRKLGKPACIKQRMLVSSRRWEEKGISGTILLMWRLRLQYFFGVDPARLYTAYYGNKR